jgi:poly-beta-1,6-N-acetyl-D-glucosamine synthase
MKYVIVIPAKNEEETIGRVLDSVLKQTILPVKCLVVDDGSTDKTGEIIQEYISRNSIFDVTVNQSTQAYVVGGHVVRLFNLGKTWLEEQSINYDYIIKLDADLDFDADYMGKIWNKIKNDNGFGIVSGTPFYYEGEKQIFEYSPIWHSHGQFKVYNRKCLQEIGGIKEMLGWDSADNAQAIEKGWKTEAFRDVYYQMFRKVGGKSSLLRGRIKHGMGAYNLGYHPLYLFMKVFHDLLKPPVIVGSSYYLFGYFKALFKHESRKLTRKQIKLLRKLFWDGFKERMNKKSFVLFQLSQNR